MIFMVCNYRGGELFWKALMFRMSFKSGHCFNYSLIKLLQTGDYSLSISVGSFSPGSFSVVMRPFHEYTFHIKNMPFNFLLFRFYIAYISAFFVGRSVPSISHFSLAIAYHLKMIFLFEVLNLFFPGLVIYLYFFIASCRDRSISSWT